MRSPPSRATSTRPDPLHRDCRRCAGARARRGPRTRANTPVSSSFPGRMDWNTNSPKAIDSTAGSCSSVATPVSVRQGAREGQGMGAVRAQRRHPRGPDLRAGRLIHVHQPALQHAGRAVAYPALRPGSCATGRGSMSRRTSRRSRSCRRLSWRHGRPLACPGAPRRALDVTDVEPGSHGPPAQPPCDRTAACPDGRSARSLWQIPSSRGTSGG